MAGHRRTRHTTPPPLPQQPGHQPAVARIGGGGLPAHIARADRIRTTAHARHAAALDPREQFTIAVDYVRAAEAAAFRAGAADLDQLVTDAAGDLMALGDELAAALEQQGHRR